VWRSDTDPTNYLDDVHRWQWKTEYALVSEKKNGKYISYWLDEDISTKLSRYTLFGTETARSLNVPKWSILCSSEEPYAIDTESGDIWPTSLSPTKFYKDCVWLRIRTRDENSSPKDPTLRSKYEHCLSAFESIRKDVVKLKKRYYFIPKQVKDE